MMGRRREILTPVAIAPPKTIKPMATMAAINTISIWIAMISLDLRRSARRRLSVALLAAGERIRDKIAASKRRGMWMGGPLPLGYDVHDRKLVVNEAEAETGRSCRASGGITCSKVARCAHQCSCVRQRG